MNGKPNKTWKTAVITTENEEKALELRKAGGSYRAIAKTMGISPGQACKLVKRGLSRLVEKCKEGAEQVQALELERLDQLLLGLWPAASRGSTQAVDKVLKIMERRSALLGLDAPKKIAPTDPSGNNPYHAYSDTELAAEIARLMSQQAPIENIKP